MATPVWVTNFDLIVKSPNDFQTKLPPPQSPYAMQALIVLVSSVFAYAVFRLNKPVGLAVGLLGIVMALRYKTHYQYAVDQYIDPIIEGLNEFHFKLVNYIRNNIDMNRSYSQKKVEKEINRLNEAYYSTEMEFKIGDLSREIVWTAEMDDPYLQSKKYELQRMALRLISGTSDHSEIDVNTPVLNTPHTIRVLTIPRPPSYARPVLVGDRLVGIESWDD